MRDFGQLLVREQRDNGKALVRDVVRNVNLQIEPEEERKRLRNVDLEQGHQLIDRDQGAKI